MSFATRNIGAARAGIAILIIFLVGTAMAVLAAVPLPEQNKDVFIGLVGGLTTALGMVCGYYFNVGGRRSPGA